MKSRLSAVLLSCFALSISAQSAAAQDAPSPYPVVIELFTSQGCSSCPPADALLAELAERDDVLALALHVDYWDYIGWKDIFADPRFTQRQRAYAKAAGHRTIYTPQMIVGGQDHIVGFKPMKLADLISAHKRKIEASQLGLSAVRSGDTLSIALNNTGAGPNDLMVTVVGYRAHENVTIRVGENAGKSIDYANIVTSWTHVGDWDGTSPVQLGVGLTSADPVAVILQQNLDGLPGEIVAAMRVN
jgi:hypothetical protein